MRIRGAIFDMDGTLVDSLMFWDDFWARLGKKYLGKADFRPTEEVDRAVRTMILSDAAVYINRACALGASDGEIVEYSIGMLEEFYKTTAKVKRGATELLRTMQSEGVRLAVASATDKKYVLIALRCLGLDKYFDIITSCSEIGRGKDCPDVYLMARDLIGLRTEDVAVFEDAPLAVRTASEAGFFTVGVFDGHNPDQDTVRKYANIYHGEGKSLAELKNML